MNVLTTIGNPKLIDWINGLFFVLISTYKFTSIVYKFFNDREMNKK